VAGRGGGKVVETRKPEEGVICRIKL